MSGGWDWIIIRNERNKNRFWVRWEFVTCVEWGEKWNPIHSPRKPKRGPFQRRVLILLCHCEELTFFFTALCDEMFPIFLPALFTVRLFARPAENCKYFYASKFVTILCCRRIFQVVRLQITESFHFILSVNTLIDTAMFASDEKEIECKYCSRNTVTSEDGVCGWERLQHILDCF